MEKCFVFTVSIVCPIVYIFFNLTHQHKLTLVKTGMHLFMFPDICRLPKKVGPCYGSFSQWYYDAAYGSCLEFTYGGCDGNENNFDTEEECILRCDPDGLVRRPTPSASMTALLMLCLF